MGTFVTPQLNTLAQHDLLLLNATRFAFAEAVTGDLIPEPMN